MTNKRGRGKRRYKTEQRKWHRGREIPWEGEKQRLRGREKGGGMKGR